MRERYQVQMYCSRSCLQGEAITMAISVLFGFVIFNYTMPEPPIRHCHYRPGWGGSLIIFIRYKRKQGARNKQAFIFFYLLSTQYTRAFLQSHSSAQTCNQVSSQRLLAGPADLSFKVCDLLASFFPLISKIPYLLPGIDCSAFTYSMI